MGSGTKNRFDGLLARLALVGFSLLLVLGGLELALRLSDYSATVRIVNERGESAYEPDPDLGYRMAEDFRGRMVGPEFQVDWRTNAQGFRNEFDFDEDDSNVILLVGDSFAAGHGVRSEEAVGTELQRRLDGYKVYNLAVAGYSPKQYAKLVERYAPRYEPAAVVVMFYVGNDVQETCGLILRSLDAEGFRNDPTTRERPRSALRRALRTSQAARFLSSRIRGLLGRASKKDYSSRAVIPFYGIGENAETRSCIEQTRETLAQLRSVAARQGFETAMVLIPTREQVSPDHAKHILQAYPDARLSLPNERLIEISTELGFKHLDLTGPFASAEDPDALFFSRDGHWCGAGHALAGAEIATFLRTTVLAEPRLAHSDE